VGNVAIAEERLGGQQTLKAKTRFPPLRVAQDNTGEESVLEALAPPRGLMNGIGLSLMLWGLLVIIYWMYGGF